MINMDGLGLFGLFVAFGLVYACILSTKFDLELPTLSRQIPQPPTTGTVTGQVVDNATGAPIQGAEVPVIDAEGNSVVGITDEFGNFQIEAAAGEKKLNYVIVNGLNISIPELVINVTVGEIYNIGVVGVDWMTRH
jgi:hypothetical protein